MAAAVEAERLRREQNWDALHGIARKLVNEGDTGAHARLDAEKSLEKALAQLPQPCFSSDTASSISTRGPLDAEAIAHMRKRLYEGAAASHEDAFIQGTIYYWVGDYELAVSTLAPAIKDGLGTLLSEKFQKVAVQALEAHSLALFKLDRLAEAISSLQIVSQFAAQHSSILTTAAQQGWIESALYFLPFFHAKLGYGILFAVYVVTVAAFLFSNAWNERVVLAVLPLRLPGNFLSAR